MSVCPAGPYVTGALFDLHGGKQTAMIVLGAIQFALGVLILFFRPKQQARPRRAHPPVSVQLRALALQRGCLILSMAQVGVT